MEKFPQKANKYADHYYYSSRSGVCVQKLTKYKCMGSNTAEKHYKAILE